MPVRRVGGPRWSAGVLMGRVLGVLVVVLAQPVWCSYQVGGLVEGLRGPVPGRREQDGGEGRDGWLDAAAVVFAGTAPTALLGIAGCHLVWLVAGPLLRGWPGVSGAVDAALGVFAVMGLTGCAAPVLAWLLLPGAAPRGWLGPRGALLLNGLALLMALPLAPPISRLTL